MQPPLHHLPLEDIGSHHISIAPCVALFAPFGTFATSRSTWCLSSTFCLWTDTTPIQMQKRRHFQSGLSQSLSGNVTKFFLVWSLECDRDFYQRARSTMVYGRDFSSSMGTKSFYLQRPYELSGLRELKSVGVYPFHLFPLLQSWPTFTLFRNLCL